MEKVRVWDLPLRLFHWLLVVAVVAAFVCGQIGGNLMEWHGRLGQFILGLLTFRLVWGFVGSTHARFAAFFPTPGKIRAYIRGEWQGLGHNPLGALSVFALLGLLAVQVATGLFANDEIAFQGPLHDLVSEDLSGRLSAIHEIASKLLMVLVALHLGAIAFYARVKKTNLVRPMLTGTMEVPSFRAAGKEAPQGGGLFAFLLALALASALAWAIGSGAITRHFAPPLPPPAASPPPAW